MTHPEPFGEARDPRLGTVLRAHLDGGAHDDFVARVMGRVEAQPNAWEELARWARPGVAAAIIALATLGFWGALELDASGAPAEVAEAAGLQAMDSDGLIGVALSSAR